MSQPASTPVIGRDDELDSLRAFLDAVEQGPTALLLSGEPGIGKTILWETAVEEFRSRFGRVLSCRGVEAEASFAFAGLSELLAEVLDEVAPALAPPRRRALEVALLLTDPGDQPPDAHMIGLALLDLVRVLAESGPVLVAIDDLQWLDASSVAVLQVAVRRLRGQPVGILATVREAPDATVPGELERSFQDQGLTRLSLDPLSLGAVHHLLHGRLGIEPTRAALARVHETSGGNPFFALELARQGTGLEPGERLPVPDSLGALLGERLARLPEETRDLLLIAAAAGRATVDVIATAGGNAEQADEALEPALRDGVIEIADSRVRFSHPLLASICLEQAPPRRRRAVHMALVNAISDVEEQGRHLALAAAGPDADIALRLDEAAEHAAARGAPAAAAELCELGAELTPPEDVAENRRRRFDAAEFHRLAGDLERAAGILERLLPGVPSGLERADVLMALASTRTRDPTMTTQLCDQALAEAGNDDARSVRILSFRGYVCAIYGGDFRGGVADARAALELAERIAEPRLLAAVIAQVGAAETWVGEITPGLLERGVEIEERLGWTLESTQSPRMALARRQVHLGQLDLAREALKQAEAEARARGDADYRWLCFNTLASLEWSAGNLRQALARATAAHEIAATDMDRTELMTNRNRALAQAELGLVDEARASAEAGLAASQDVSNEFYATLYRGVLGRLELSLGNVEAAARLLRDLPDRLLSAGVTDPAQPIWPDSIEALISLGELDRARGYLDRYELNAERLGIDSAAAVARRCRGLLAAGEGDLEAAFEAYGRALAALDVLPFQLERGRTLLCLGSAHRQAKQKRLARDALDQSIAIFEELGARLWADRARAELARISGRRRASEEELTEMEERVAGLAAQGHSNKEIAAELFVSVHTVGAHLSRTYRKLGIRSRSELAGRLGGSTGEVVRPG